MKMNPFNIAAAFFILLSLNLSLIQNSQAELYECSDEEGNVTHHSKSPCPQGYTSRMIENSSPNKARGAYSGTKAQKYKNVEVISRGTLVDLIDHIDYGKYTVFLFYADWCAPCKTVKPKLEQKARQSDTFALKELDVLNWENPLVRYYNLGGLPYFIVYGPEGKFVERGPVLSKEFMNKISDAR